MDTSLNPADNYIVKENKQKKEPQTKRKGAIIVGNLLKGEKAMNANKLFSGESGFRHTERSSGPEDNYFEAVDGDYSQGAFAVSPSALGTPYLVDQSSNLRIQGEGVHAKEPSGRIVTAETSFTQQPNQSSVFSTQDDLLS